jgi:hypothetical protein
MYHLGLPAKGNPSGGLLQQSSTQGDIRTQLLHLGVLFLQFFETFGLIYAHAAVFLALAVVGLFGDPWLLTDLAYSSRLAEQNFGYTCLLMSVPS